MSTMPAPTDSSMPRPDFSWLVAEMQHAGGSVLAPREITDRPIHGQTLFLAECSLEMRFGTFRAYVFQDIIDKHYLIALAYGDIVHAEKLYTRVHSSCVTSETLRGCDCDCVQQLEGALRRISEAGSGILFYLMQEGRGVGYVGKARDRMLVQASLDQVSTFQAYAAMGLEKDHRRYDNIAHICTLLGIHAPFVVLTNNPDKVEALRSLGIAIAGTETLEIEPSPFNLAYLTSKAAAGHILTRPAASRVRRALPPEPVVPFRPHAIANAQRFIYAASYFLPVRPVDDDILLSEETFNELFKQRGAEQHMAGPEPLVQGYQLIRGNRFLVRVNADHLAAFRKANPQDPIGELLSTPYWFRVHVYYDIVTNQDFVVLTHGRPCASDIPVVRIQSESLFNRFPLRTVENRDKFMQTMKHIVTYGSGAVLLLHNDGRGAGFGAYATDRMLTETHRAASTDEAYRVLGVDYDSRDYDACVLLLKQHLPGGKIQMVMNSPDSLVSKTEYAEALKKHRIDVERWIFLADEA
ncbi:GTP cyclohydrolase-2 [mine drainage metagenome]|uniref:GTP cyclohydrolase-2 n=1 Tax=mine drainage metagenome TaxID=410659 RepID=A0A1J5S5R2_9ZZZZ